MHIEVDVTNFTLFFAIGKSRVLGSLFDEVDWSEFTLGALFFVLNYSFRISKCGHVLGIE